MGLGDPQDAGPVDAGIAAYSPIVGADGGEMRLGVAPEPGSSCAALMPSPVDPLSTNLDISPNQRRWGGATTDGRGEMLFSMATDSANFFATPSSDGGVTSLGFSGGVVPQSSGFLLDSVVQGACLICNETLVTYPGNASVPLGNGLSTQCSFAPRSDGDGAYVSCWYNSGPATFSRYDASLQLLWQREGDATFIIQSDAAGKLLELNRQTMWRWVDETLTPLSDYFPASTGLFGYRPQRLIGGGLFDTWGGRLIPSGSAQPVAPPPWMAARPGLSIVLGGRAYALSANDCSLEIRDPAGTLCGTVTIENCRQPPSPGFDGTITMPIDASGSLFSQFTYVSWPGVLR